MEILCYRLPLLLLQKNCLLLIQSDLAWLWTFLFFTMRFRVPQRGCSVALSLSLFIFELFVFSFIFHPSIPFYFSSCLMLHKAWIYSFFPLHFLLFNPLYCIAFFTSLWNVVFCTGLATWLNTHLMRPLQNLTASVKNHTRIVLLLCSFLEITSLYGPQICQKREVTVMSLSFSPSLLHGCLKFIS